MEPHSSIVALVRHLNLSKTDDAGWLGPALSAKRATHYSRWKALQIAVRIMPDLAKCKDQRNSALAQIIVFPEDQFKTRAGTVPD